MVMFPSIKSALNAAATVRHVLWLTSVLVASPTHIYIKVNACLRVLMVIFRMSLNVISVLLSVRLAIVSRYV